MQTSLTSHKSPKIPSGSAESLISSDTVCIELHYTTDALYAESPSSLLMLPVWTSNSNRWMEMDAPAIRPRRSLHLLGCKETFSQ